MKILHLSSNTIWRGGEQQVDHLFNHQSAVFNKYLFCPEDSELNKRNLSKREKIFTYTKRFGFDPFSAWELKKISAKNKIDIIHLHDSHSINTYLLADLFGMNVPAVIHRHVNFPVNTKWKYTYHKIAQIICVSDVVKESMMKVVDEKKLVVIHPGIDINRFGIWDLRFEINKLRIELNIPEDVQIIGTVSALEKEKNIDEFISIAKILLEKNKNLFFVIAGDGSLREDLEASIIREGLQNHIKILGFREDIPGILSSLDLFLFTTGSEGFGLVLLEAMAAGIPIVSTNPGGIQDILMDNENGLVYRAGNPEDAVEKIVPLLADEKLRTALTENASRFVQQFDVTLMNQKIENVYNTII